MSYSLIGQYNGGLKKGDVFLTISCPCLNQFYLQPGDSTKINTGIAGLNAGVKVFTNPTRYLEVSTGFMFGTLPLEYDVSQEVMISAYVRVNRNHFGEDFSWGYGLNYSYNVWRLDYKDGSSPGFAEQRLAQGGIGPALNGYIHFLDFFFMGIQYNSVMLNPLHISRSEYEHVISIEAGLTFKL